MRIWQLQEARSHFKALFDEAVNHGPQKVTRHGQQAVIVVSEDEWRNVTSQVPRFGALLAQCPLDQQDLSPRRPARLFPDDEP